MPDHAWSLQDAKNRLSAVVEAARRGGPLFVTKRGVPAVVVLAAGTRAADRLYLSVVDHR